MAPTCSWGNECPFVGEGDAEGGNEWDMRNTSLCQYAVPTN
jgi:hypothetical protein